LSADLERDKGQENWEGEVTAEPKNDSEWRIAIGEIEVFLEGSVPALPKNFGASTNEPSNYVNLI